MVKNMGWRGVNKLLGKWKPIRAIDFEGYSRECWVLSTRLYTNKYKEIIKHGAMGWERF